MPDNVQSAGVQVSRFALCRDVFHFRDVSSETMLQSAIEGSTDGSQAAQPTACSYSQKKYGESYHEEKPDYSDQVTFSRKKCIRNYIPLVLENTCVAERYEPFKIPYQK